jgi:hypothetical protein
MMKQIDQQRMQGLNFPQRLNMSESLLLPPSGEELENVMSLITGSFNSESPMLMDSEDDQSVIKIDRLELSGSSLAHDCRINKPLSLLEGRGHFSENHAPPFRRSVEDRSRIDIDSSSLHIVDVEDFFPFNLFREPGMSERRQHLDPDEQRTLENHQVRPPSPFRLEKEQLKSHAAPLNNAAQFKKVSTNPAA